MSDGSPFSPPRVHEPPPPKSVYALRELLALALGLDSLAQVAFALMALVICHTTGNRRGLNPGGWRLFAVLMVSGSSGTVAAWRWMRRRERVVIWLLLPIAFHLAVLWAVVTGSWRTPLAR
jgi:predicted alpha/beta hydrolase